jgi:flagellar hook assembly protein FlgD
MNGQKVRTLVDGYRDAGEHTVTWNAKNDSGESVASGMYLYRFKSGDTIISRKMTLLK